MTFPIFHSQPTAIFTYLPSTSGSRLLLTQSTFTKMTSTACHITTDNLSLSHCGHRHDLTSVAQLSVVNIADIRVS